MPQVMLESADSQLAHLVDQVREGEEVIILRDSTPVAEIVPLPEEKPKERQGSFGSGKDDILYMTWRLILMRRWKTSRIVCDASDPATRTASCAFGNAIPR